ncbi:MAG: hypothetical protein U9O98_08315, partial [Asgard group archaeon]|nr:hypothetical protein [Asgard group archaeon]
MNTDTLLTIIIGYLITSIIIAINILLVIKYRQRKKTNTLILISALSFFGLATFSLGTGDLLTALNATSYNLRYVGMTLGYIFTIAACIAIFQFTVQIFLPRLTWVRIFHPISGGFIIGVLFDQIIPVTSNNFWGDFANELQTKASLWTIILMLVYTLITFSILLIYAFKQSNQADFIWEKRGFQMIGIFALLTIISYLFFTLDSIVDAATGNPTQY